MLIKLFQRAKWHSKQVAEALGVAGVLGLSIVAFCAMFLIGTIQPMRQQLAELHAQIATQPIVKAQANPEDPITQLHRQLTAFYQFFPNRDDMAGQVENLFAAAKRYNLVLENGSYELTHGDAHKLAKCEVQLPIKGSYVQTRQFLASVLQEMPNVALSAIDIQRQKIGDATINAQIKLTLYYQET